MAFDQPDPVVAILEIMQCLLQLFNGPEGVRLEQILQWQTNEVSRHALRIATERVRDLGKDQENRGTGDCPCPDLTIDAYFYSMLTAVVLTNDRESPLVEKWVA